jgi:hypothetical protein
MNISTTDLEVKIVDIINPCAAHTHPENRLTSDKLNEARSVIKYIKENERMLNDFLLEQSNGEHTEFRVVVNPDGSFYAHVLGRDSETVDGKLLKETKMEWSYYYQKWI